MAAKSQSKTVVPIIRSAKRSHGQAQVRKQRELRLMNMVNPVAPADTGMVAVEKNKDMAGTTTPMSTMREPESVRGL